jgi:hypothetical protein
MELAISRALLLAVLVGACHGSLAEDLQGFLQVRSFLSQRNEQQYKIATANGIDEARYVPVGGGEQYISIRGEDRANPVILFLHGGPGDATNPWGYLAFRSWLKHFTVVQWDQRGAGRTLRKSGGLHDTDESRSGIRGLAARTPQGVRGDSWRTLRGVHEVRRIPAGTGCPRASARVIGPSSRSAKPAGTAPAHCDW